MADDSFGLGFAIPPRLGKAAVTRISICGVGADYLDICWTIPSETVDDCASVQIWLAGDPDTLLDTVACDASPYRHQPLVSGTQYCYYVIVRDSTPNEIDRSGTVCGYAGLVPAIDDPGDQLDQISVAASLQMTATSENMPVTWSATNLPTGLSIDSGTGLITGTPTATGTFASTVYASNYIGQSSIGITWYVEPATSLAVTEVDATTLRLTWALTPTVGAFCNTLEVWRVGAPDTLLDTVACDASPFDDTLLTPGDEYCYYLIIKDTKGDQVNRSVTACETAGVPPSIVDPGAQSSIVDQYDELQMVASSPGLAVTWSAVGLPAGMTIDSNNGLISGTPTVEASYTPTVTAVNVKGSDNVQFDWNVTTQVGIPDVLVEYDFSDPSQMASGVAASFDGNNYLEIEQAAVSVYPMTMACWFKSNGTGQRNVLFIGDNSKTNAWQRMYVSGASLFLHSREAAENETVSVAINATDGNPHFAAAVLASDTLRTVHGDDQSASNTENVTITSSYNVTSIGRRSTSAPLDYFIGEVDNAIIFATALTPQQIDWIRINKPTYDDLVSSTDPDNPGVDDIAAMWHLDEMTGTRMDVSGKAMHLSPGGLPKGVTFTAADNDYSVGDSPTPTLPFSVTGSFKRSVTNATENLIYVGSTASNRQRILIATSDQLRIASQSAASGTQNIDSPTAIQDTDWHFLGGLFAEDSRSIAVDDETFNEDIGTVTPDADLAEVVLCSDRPTSGTNGLTGTLDNWAIWNITLTQAQYDWLRAAAPGGLPVTYSDVRLIKHPDNPGIGAVAAWYQLNEDSPESPGTLVNIHNPGTYDMTTSSTGAGPVSAEGHVIDLPYGVEGIVEGIPEVDDLALEFSNTTNSHCISSVGPTLSYPFCLEAWARTLPLDYNRPFLTVHLDDSNHARLDHHGAGCRARLLVAGGNEFVATSGVTFNDNTLHHVVGIFTASTIRIAFDGNLGGQTAHSMGMFDPTSVRVGTGRDVTSCFNGVIDEPRFWARELTEQQISDLYNNGAGLLTDDIINDRVTITGGIKPEHGWPINANDPNGLVDLGTVGGITLSAVNSPVPVIGIPAGRKASEIWKVNDLGDNNHDLIQDVLSLRPLLIQVIEGDARYAVSFDGVDDLMGTLANIGHTQPCDIWMVVQDIGTDVLYEAGSARTRLRTSVTPTYQMASTDNVDTIHQPSGLEIMLAVFNTNASYLYRNGVPDGPFDVGTANPTAALQLSRFDRQLSGNVLAMIIIDQAHDTATRNYIGELLAAKFGLSWTPIT